MAAAKDEISSPAPSHASLIFTVHNSQGKIKQGKSYLMLAKFYIAPNEGFFLNALESLFRLPRVLLDLLDL